MSGKGKKITIVGAGNVGATIAYTLTLAGLAAEIVMVDVNREKAEGEAMDIIQGTAFCPPVRIYAGDYAASKDSDIVIIAAGLGRKPGMTRIDLCKTNIEIIRQIVKPVVAQSPNAIYVVVSNPADVLTYATLKISGLPQSRVIGSGTLLDSSRLRTAISHRLNNVNIHDIQAFVLGEHGDTSMIPWSLTSICGMPMTHYCNKNGLQSQCTPEVFEQITQEVRTGGAEVIKRKGATFFAIALSVRRICEALLRDSKSVLTVASLMTGEYGMKDVCVSLPYIVGARGLEQRVELEMTADEIERLQASGAALRKVLDEIEI